MSFLSLFICSLGRQLRLFDRLSLVFVTGVDVLVACLDFGVNRLRTGFGKWHWTHDVYENDEFVCVYTTVNIDWT